MLRIPRDVEKRKQWIDKIKNHQAYTQNDEETIRFCVCSEHFESSELKKIKGQIVPGCPTIFPDNEDIGNSVADFDTLPADNPKVSSTQKR